MADGGIISKGIKGTFDFVCGLANPKKNPTIAIPLLLISIGVAEKSYDRALLGEAVGPLFASTRAVAKEICNLNIQAVQATCTGDIKYFIPG